LGDISLDTMDLPNSFSTESLILPLPVYQDTKNKKVSFAFQMLTHAFRPGGKLTGYFFACAGDWFRK